MPIIAGRIAVILDDRDLATTPVSPRALIAAPCPMSI